ncbi:interferon regulatory factor 3-like [Polyodon spathula]|uniref:interferon regulatory factor 3-like n=1 Tax=Polyodon spathula TaxID=7913 RepID=UPI001B7F1253|nr:interferon regulatory factor 3-like [Polyodon spathula]
MQSTAYQKPQFSKWLIEQINSGQYPGLEWVDRDCFRIPWKHNSRKDCNDDDCMIFKAWAIASEKFHENQNDKAKWKTNFRGALNSLKNFIKIQDKSKELDDPHKVYQIVEMPTNSVSAIKEDETAQQYVNPQPSPAPIIYQNQLIPQYRQPMDVQQELLNKQLHTLNIGNQYPDDSQWDQLPTYGMPIEEYPIEPVPYAQDQVSQNAIPNHIPEPPYNAENEPLLPDLNDLEITIYYRKQTVLFAQLRGPKVQFHYNKEDPCLGPDGLVCFPGTEQLMDHRQIKYTQKLLNSIQRGLLLEVKPRGIYGTRLDKCHVYTAHNVPVIEEPSKLPNNREVELLSFQKYIKDLIDFKENKRGSPDYTIYLCFGEKFPDGKPKDTKLILVKVVPLVCRFWHEMAQREGASSLQSDNISLQLSNNSLYELINSYLSDLEMFSV